MKQWNNEGPFFFIYLVKNINLPQHETKTNDLPFVCMQT